MVHNIKSSWHCVLMFLCTVFLMTGCASESFDIIVCQEEMESYSIQETLFGLDDQLVKSERLSVIDYGFNASDDDVLSNDDLFQLFLFLQGSYQDLKGVQFEFDIDQKVVTHVLTIDYREASHLKLYQKGLLDVDGYGYISLNGTVSNMEKDGFVCQSPKEVLIE